VLAMFYLVTPLKHKSGPVPTRMSRWTRGWPTAFRPEEFVFL